MPRYPKGSPEAKAWAEKMRQARESKSSPVTSTAVAEQPRATMASTEAGIQMPPRDIRRGTLIKQLTDEQLEAELEHTTAEDFVKRHHDKMDANYDAMARVLRITPEEVRQMLKDQGYVFSPGA